MDSLSSGLLQNLSSTNGTLLRRGSLCNGCEILSDYKHASIFLKFEIPGSVVILIAGVLCALLLKYHSANTNFLIKVASERAETMTTIYPVR